MSNRNHARILLGSIAALGLSGLCAPSAFAVTYTIVPSGTGTPLDWNTAGNWTSSGGTIPGASASDTATVSADFGGFAQTVNISANLANGLTALTLGDTNATPSATTIGSTGGSLSFAAAANINSAGTVGAVNTISAPIVLGGALAFGTTALANVISSTPAANNALIISGKITTSAAASRNIDNFSGKTVTLGDIDISTGATTGIALTIRAGFTSTPFFMGSNYVLNGTIANGGSVAANLALGSRAGNIGIGTSSIQINGSNTYTGTTTLGIQGNTNTVFRINSDQPFGPANGGTLTIGNNSYVNTLEAVGSDRTISKNSTVINRSVVFQGANSLTIASPVINFSNGPSTGNTSVGVFGMINNDITATGKAVTLGSVGGNIYLNGSNVTDFYRLRDVKGAGTTIIPSSIADNSGAVPTVSRMVVSQAGTGSLILTGANTFQGGLRITGTGTVQLGSGSTTGSFVPSNSITPVVNGTAAGTLAFNRSDAVSTALTANGPINLVQKGTGSLTLSNSQFHSGSTTVGDGTSASKLVVTGSLVPSRSTTTNATAVNSLNSQLNTNTVTLAGGDTTTGLNLKVGQPVYLTSGGANSLAYVDSIISATQFSIFGGTLLANTTTPSVTAGLSFGEGSALGTSAATTTVNNHSTLAGTGVISGSVSALTGSHLAPGVNTTDGDFSSRFNFGVAGTLTTGALTLTGADLDFDLAATAAGVSDLLVTGANAVSFSSLNFTFDALTAGTLELGTAYSLVSGSGVFTGNASLITTTFNGALAGLYTPTYSVTPSGLQVIFTAPVPEPATFGLIAGMAMLGGCLVRRRRKSQA